MAVQIQLAGHAIFSRVLLIGLLCFGNGLAQSRDEDGSSYKVERQPNENTTFLFIGSSVILTFNISISGKHDATKVTLVPKERTHFDFVFNELQFEGQETAGESQAQLMEVNITGSKLVISEFSLVAVSKNGKSDNILTHYLKVKRIPNRIALIVRYSVTAAVVVSVWLMGITTDFKLIVSIIKRPFPLLIGMLCQYVIMPFSAWSLAKIFQIEGAAGLGLVLDGSCPGGTNSNLFSILLDVDYVLSITMTCFSVIMALGMMPLNIFIYGSAFVEAGQNITTPFFDIFIQLLFLVVPLCVGIFLGWWSPKLKKFAEKYLKPFAAVLVFALLIVDLPFNLFIFDSPWSYYIVAVIFPFIGGLAGFIISKISRLTTRRSLTVALETGIQNAILAGAILLFSYPQPESDLATRIPYLILIFTTIEGLLLSVIYNLLKKFHWHGVPYDGEREGDDVVDSNVYESGKTDKHTNEPNPIVPTVSSKVVSNKDSSCQVNLGPDGITYFGEVNNDFRPE